MSIKNPLLEKYCSHKQELLTKNGSLTKNGLLNSSQSVTSTLLKRSPDPNLLSSPKSLKSSILSSSATSLSLLTTKVLKPQNLSSKFVGKLSHSIPRSLPMVNTYEIDSKSVFLQTKEIIKPPKSTTTEKIENKDSGVDFQTPFLDSDDFIPVTVKSNVINNYFDAISKSSVVITHEEVLKQDFINLAACSLIHVPKLDQKDDDVRERLIYLADQIIAFDPEFILKTALFTRLVLNIRVTANFLVALAGFNKDCRRYMKKYYEQTVVLPSDWIDVAELYTSLGDKNIGFSALPVCLRKAMSKKFPKFDVYQIGKYNKNPKKKSKTEETDSEAEDDETKLYERHHFTLKQLIRKIHICEPPDIVMPILGKKYPGTQEDFYRSRLSGIWDESKSGKRMKIPTPYTWETQLASKGNNASTWKALILSKKLPYMAMLRNLRNIIQSGVSDNIHKIVQKKLSSSEDVKRSRQFPFRFLSAYAVLDGLKIAKSDQPISWSTTPEFEQDTLLDDYKSCLDKAVQLSAVNNVKPIKGALLIMFYCGSSMDEQCSTKGFGLKRTIREIAGLMTLMCMFSSEHCDVVYYNEFGTAMGKKIETGGEILKFLSAFIDESKSALENITVNQTNHLTTNDCWTDMIDKERRYDTIIQIAPTCNSWEVNHCLYRQKVNNDVLMVNINLKSKITTITDDYILYNSGHRNDIRLHGFSDQMLKYISERGSGELLSNVESIDKKFNLLPLPKPMAQNYVSPLSKQVTTNVVRIFVSSTFIDLEIERKQLMSIVIPEISKIAMEKNVSIQEVDLRWGITKEEAMSNKVILRCLEELSRCHYFLCIIGTRYGTSFTSFPKSPNPEFAWLQSENAEMSMTELEIKHAFHLAGLKKLSPKNMIFLVNEDEEVLKSRDLRLQRVIHMIEKHNVKEELYYKGYKGNIQNGFAEVAETALKDVVISNILRDVSEDMTEDEMHTSFLEQQALLFVGRQNLLTDLVTVIKKDAIILVTGPVGSGKSALSAKALTMFNSDDKLCDFYHLVKLNSISKDLSNLIIRLCFHMSKVLNEELEEHFEPITTLWGQIAKCEAPFKVLIDGCDELIHSPDLFSWLPDKIPSNMKFIFTASSSSQWHTYLDKKYPSLTAFSVAKLSSTEKIQVTKEMLAAYGKKLEEKGFNSQLSLLLSKKEANNPLFIDLCINQLRLNAVFENLTQCIQELPQTTEELYMKILNFAAKEIPVCKKVLAYLYCSKNNISESDMLLFLQLKPLVLVNILYYLKLFINVDQNTGIMSLANLFAKNFSISVTCLAASSFCSIILIGFQDSKFQALDSDNSKTIQTYRGHSGPVTCCGFITSSRFISAGSDGSLRLWGLLDSVCITSITPHVYQVKDIDVNIITKCVLSAGIDRRVTVWHNDVIFDTIEFEHPMNCISFIENGKKFVAGSWNGDIFAYDLVEKVKISVKKSGKVHKNSIRSLSAGKRQFATLDIIGIISIWDQVSLDVLKSVRLNNVTTLSYDFNDQLIFGHSNGIIKVTSGFGQMSLLPYPAIGPVTALTKFDDTILVGYYNGAVFKMLPSGEPKKLTQHKGKVNCIAVINISNISGFSSPTTFVASCSDDGSVHLSAFHHQKEEVKVVVPHIGKILAVCPGKGNIMFTGGADCAITASKFEMKDSELTSQEVKLYGHQAPVSTLLLLKEGDRLISGSHDGSVMLWNTNQGKCMYTSFNTHTDWVTCSAARGETASFFVTGSNDNLVILWKLETSRILPINKLMGHSSPVNCVGVLGGDGTDIEMIIGGAQDGTLVLWNKNGRLISSSTPGNHGVNACTFDHLASEATAYVGTADGDVVCVQPSKLNVITSLTHHTDAVKSVAGMSGCQLVSTSSDNTVQAWAWNKAASNTTKLQSITDIKYQFAGGVYKIGAVDNTGCVANWTLQDDTLTLLSETDAPDEMLCFALLPPTVDGDFTLYVTDNEQVSRVLTSNTYTLEFVAAACDKMKLQVHDREHGNEDLLAVLPRDMINHAHITQDNILQIGKPGGILDVWNLKTKKRMSNASLNMERSAAYKTGISSFSELPYPTASTFYDGKNIVGTNTGHIKVPQKKGKHVYERVFNCAVTVIQCISNNNEGMLLFAGSKDGIIKVLTSELKVMGMYHTSGPVTALCVLGPCGRNVGEVYVAAGDKCGVLHVLKWFPPSTVKGIETEESNHVEEEKEEVEMDTDSNHENDEVIDQMFD